MNATRTSAALHTNGALSESTAEKFARLRDDWLHGRGHESSTSRLVMHPAYQKIIGMGPDVVPLLLKELQQKPEAWFWALRSITEEDPVEVKDRGNGEAMAQAWLKWASAKGIRF